MVPPGAGEHARRHRRHEPPLPRRHAGAAAVRIPGGQVRRLYLPSGRGPAAGGRRLRRDLRQYQVHGDGRPPAVQLHRADRPDAFIFKAENLCFFI